LSGPFYSKIGTLISSDDEQALDEEIQWLKGIFGEDFYFQVARHKMSAEDMASDRIDQEPWLMQKMLDAFDKQEKVLSKLKELGSQLGIDCVATNDIRYLEKEDWQAHEILMNVSSGEPCEIWEKDAYGNPKARILNPKRHTAYSHELYFKSNEVNLHNF